MALHHGYVGAVRCTAGPQPGVQGAMAWFLAKYARMGGVNSGIYNCRTVRGGSTTSIHGEGRAGDFGIRPHSAAYGTALAEQLRLNSKELGIQCVIWNRRIWSGSYPTSGWRRYSGVNPHVDHLHVEFTWATANRSRQSVINLFESVLGGTTAPAPATPAPEKPKTFLEEIMSNHEQRRRHGDANRSVVKARTKARVRANNPVKGQGDGKGVHHVAKAIKGRDYIGSITVKLAYLPAGKDVTVQIVGVQYPGGGKPAIVTEYAHLPIQSFVANSSGAAWANLTLDDRAGFNGEYQVQINNWSDTDAPVTEVRSSTHHS